MTYFVRTTQIFKTTILRCNIVNICIQKSDDIADTVSSTNSVAITDLSC